MEHYTALVFIFFYFYCISMLVLQVLEGSGLRSLLPCLHLVRTVRLNGSQFDDSSVRKLTEVASEVRRTQRSALLHFWHRHCDKNMRILRE